MITFSNIVLHVILSSATLDHDGLYNYLFVSGLDVPHYIAINNSQQIINKRGIFRVTVDMTCLLSKQDNKKAYFCNADNMKSTRFNFINER